jgi:hypothetical protein
MTTQTTIVCGACGIQFSLPEVRRADLKKSGDTFYCPNGHPRVYKPTEVDELQAKLACAQSDVRNLLKSNEDAASLYRCPFGDCPHFAFKRHVMRRHISKHHGDER